MRGSAIPYITHGHYYIKHADALAPGAYHSQWTDDRLLYPAPDGDEGGGIWVTAGTFDGPVSITVETFESAAEAIPDVGEWEIRQEVTIIAQGANLRVETESGPRIDLPVLQLAPGELAGVRIYARGVDAAADVQEIDLDAEPTEHHLLHLWRQQETKSK